MDEAGIHYNVTEQVILPEEVDIGRIEVAMRRLIDRHEILRTSYHLTGDEILQEVHDDYDFSVEYMEKVDDMERAAAAFIRPFDLSVSPAIRCGVIAPREGKAVLIMDMHHITTDGISVNKLKEELWHIYNGETLAEPRIQYKDYSEWQNGRVEAGELNQQEEYWLDIFP